MIKELKYTLSGAIALPSGHGSNQKTQKEIQNTTKLFSVKNKEEP